MQAFLRGAWGLSFHLLPLLLRESTEKQKRFCNPILFQQSEITEHLWIIFEKTTKYFLLFMTLRNSIILFHASFLLTLLLVLIFFLFLICQYRREQEAFRILHQKKSERLVFLCKKCKHWYIFSIFITFIFCHLYCRKPYWFSSSKV